MKKEQKLKFYQIISLTLSITMIVGSLGWSIFYSDSWIERLVGIFSVFSVGFMINIFWHFFLGKYALLYNLELIPRFFKEKAKRRNFDITRYYYLGRYFFDKEEYKKAESYFDRAMEAYFYKIAILKIEANSDESKSTAQQFGIEKDIEGFYKNNNDFIAFLKASRLYLSKAFVFFTASADGITIEHQTLIYYIKARKIISSNYDFLHDFDEDEKCFKESLVDDTRNTKEVYENFSIGSVDFRCIKAKLMLEYDEYPYYEKALEISHEIIDIIEKSTNQAILWRLLYVRGCAYHKLGEADLACKDWKRGIELGDIEFSQKMYDENCKES